MFPLAPDDVAEQSPILHWIHRRWWWESEGERVKVKAELEDPSSHCIDTFSLAGQPLVISLTSLGPAKEVGRGEEDSQQCSMARAR